MNNSSENEPQSTEEAQEPVNVQSGKDVPYEHIIIGLLTAIVVILTYLFYENISIYFKKAAIGFVGFIALRSFAKNTQEFVNTFIPSEASLKEVKKWLLYLFFIFIFSLSLVFLFQEAIKKVMN